MTPRNTPHCATAHLGRPAETASSERAPLTANPTAAAFAASLLRYGVAALTKPLAVRDDEAARERWLAESRDGADFERRDREWELHRQRLASLPPAL